MKLEKITHDHLLTKWLKVIIFAILMLSPIFSVAIRCAYVVCNKNAYQSYSDKQEISNLQINNQNSVIQQENYLLTYTYEGDTRTNSMTFVYDEINFEPTDYGFDSGYNFDTLFTRDDGYLYLKDSALNYTQYKKIWGTEITNILIHTTSITNTYSIGDNQGAMNVYITLITKGSLDNVFDYSVNELKNDQLFNWTQNTGVYTGVNAMTTGLGLTDGTISILITYWTLLSIIYVIIDIVLEGFVALTHMILKKAS